MTNWSAGWLQADLDIPSTSRLPMRISPWNMQRLEQNWKWNALVNRSVPKWRNLFYGTPKERELRSKQIIVHHQKFKLSKGENTCPHLQLTKPLIKFHFLPIQKTLKRFH